MLDIQAQLVEQAKLVPETAAAKELRKKLEELLKEANASGSSRPDRVRAIVQQARDLKVPLGTRILRLLGFVCLFPRYILRLYPQLTKSDSHSKANEGLLRLIMYSTCVLSISMIGRVMSVFLLECRTSVRYCASARINLFSSARTSIS